MDESSQKADTMHVCIYDLENLPHNPTQNTVDYKFIGMTLLNYKKEDCIIAFS